MVFHLPFISDGVLAAATGSMVRGFLFSTTRHRALGGIMRHLPPTSRAHACMLFGALALALAACSDSGTDGTTGSTESTGATTGTGGSSPCPGACADDPEKPICDANTLTCVACLPSNDVCGTGKYCNPSTNTCDGGCKDDSDCGSPLICDTTLHQCVTCLDDSQCDAGSVCSPTGECQAGCSPTQPCQGGLTCCGTSCVDLETDVDHCNACDTPCGGLANATVACVSGACTLDTCNPDFENCNLNPDDGCEQSLVAEGPCACTPGDVIPCYEGPPNTEGVGICLGGTATCNPQGTGYGLCLGQVFPTFDTCNDGLDNDCDGTPDNAGDKDGDGWTPCDGDCCDVLADGCGNPNLVNPGAFEVAGNMVDDDCDGSVDNAVVSCDGAFSSNSSVATDYAKAIELCSSTTESPALPSKKWGVISAGFFRADGTGVPVAAQRSIRTGFGGGLTPLKGTQLVVLSTGAAAASASPNNTNPAYVAPQASVANGTSSGVPSDWLTANGNNFPNAPNCPDPNGGTTANDPIMLKVRVRVPTNAFSFSVASDFYSSEYPEWVCSPFNDFFLTLLDSTFMPGIGQAANPADNNLAFYHAPPAGGSLYPIGVNLAFGNTGLFRQCKNGTTGCGGGATPGTTSSCQSTAQLAGTGFDVANPSPPSAFPGDPGYCGTNNLSGGATGWLSTSGNVVPGETIELRFVIWDTGDGYYDSTVLLDNFQWLLTASTPGTKG